MLNSLGAPLDVGYSLRATRFENRFAGLAGIGA